MFCVGAWRGESREAETMAPLRSGGVAASRHLVAHIQPNSLSSSRHRGAVVTSSTPTASFPQQRPP
jgi:hypothetical protein